MPMVKQQVESQIKVRDLSKFGVSIAPADHESWHVARAEMCALAVAAARADRWAHAFVHARQDERAQGWPEGQIGGRACGGCG